MGRFDTERERSEHSQGTNNVTDNKSLNQQRKPEYSRKAPPKYGERTTVTSKLCPWENFQESGQNKAYLHIKKTEFTTTDLF